MRKPYLMAVLVAAAFTATSAANAGNKNGGGAGPSTTPPGFGSSGGHKGFETFTHTTTTTDSTGVLTTTESHENLPSGWDQGKADWKTGLKTSNPNLTTRPPGLAGH